jgi:hypothetical protein
MITAIDAAYIIEYFDNHDVNKFICSIEPEVSIIYGREAETSLFE